MTVAAKALRLLIVSWTTLAVTVSGLSGMVLCIGADGHITLEMADHGRCHEHPEAPPVHVPRTVVAADADADADCCGDCVDVSLLSETLLHVAPKPRYETSVKASLDRLAAAPGNVAVGPVRAGFGSRHTPRGTCPRVSPALLARRTIVLRT
jgi:hypothetical protein